MNKKTMQIISLILSIVGLLYLTASYLGIIRYSQLYLYSTEYYINKFKNVTKAEKENRVIVVFKPDIDRIHKIKPFLHSILDQNVRVDDIGITIPYSDIEKIPKDIKKILTIYGYKKEHGDATNLIYSVLREPEAETKIFILEPNLVYGEDFIETVVKESNENSDSILFINDKNAGVMIKPKFFTDSMCDYNNCKDILKKCCNAKIKNIKYSPIYKIIF